LSILDALALFDPGFNIVHRTQGVGDSPLGVLTQAPDRLQRHLDIAHVVHGVEYPEYVHPVVGRTLHELRDHIVGVMAIAQNVLAAEQHLLRRIRHGFFQFPDPLPGILPQVADAGIEGGPTPGFQGPETHLVQFRRDRQHVIEAHPGGQQRLVGITQHHVSNTQRAFCLFHKSGPLLTRTYRLRRAYFF
jgi:hypothetical protein